MLGPQLHVNAVAPDPRRWQGLQDDPQGRNGAQPIGGLWTAAYDPTIGSAFVQDQMRRVDPLARWNATMPPGCNFMPIEAGIRIWGRHFNHWEYQGWLLTPQPSVRVYEVEDRLDAGRLWDQYSRPVGTGTQRYLSFRAIMQDWDAVHLTEAAAPLVGHGPPPFLDNWGHESTCWLRWCFACWTPLGWRGVEVPRVVAALPAFTDATAAKFLTDGARLRAAAGKGATPAYLRVTAAELLQLIQLARLKANYGQLYPAYLWTIGLTPQAAQRLEAKWAGGRS